jgi:hypothetical protein
VGIGLLQIEFGSMSFWIGFGHLQVTRRAVDFERRYFPSFGYAMRQESHGSPNEAIQYPILYATNYHAQLVNTITQMICDRTTKLISMLRKRQDPFKTFGVRARFTLYKTLKPR